MAFFFFNSALGRVVAGYPSPGGVTECELDLEAWDRLAAAYPLLGELTPDTEAIFVNQDEVFLIPIDMCYSLVGGAPALLAGIRRRGRGPRGAGHVPGRPAAAGSGLGAGALTWPT